MMELQEILAGVIRDAFFAARDRGETMYQASDTAAIHVLSVIEPSRLRLRLEVEKLLEQWDADRRGYPSSSDWRAPIADAAVKLCGQELRAALERAEPIVLTLETI
jgi:hypothetical protein